MQFVWPSAAPQIGDLAERVAEVVRPNPPFTLHTAEGEVVTGIVVLDRGQVLLFLGTRQSRTSASRPGYLAPERGYPERSYDADQSLWSPRPYQR